MTRLGSLVSAVFGLALSVAEAKDQGKVTSWELCTEPWYSDTGLFNTTDGNSAFNPDQSSRVVVNLHACPYKEGSRQYGVWTQECNYNIYAARYEGERQLTTCINSVVIFGEKYKDGSKGSVPTTVTWESLAAVDYGGGVSFPGGSSSTEESRFLVEEEGVKPRSWRWASESEFDEWLIPQNVEYSSLHIISGTGKLTKPHFYISNIKLEHEMHLEKNGLEVETVLEFYYKKMHYDYTAL